MDPQYQASVVEVGDRTPALATAPAEEPFVAAALDLVGRPGAYSRS